MIEYVYIITNGIEHKIGKAKDPRKRLKQLQTGHAETLYIIREYAAENARDLESFLHNRVPHLHKRGEWFVIPNIELIDNLVKEYGEVYIHRHSVDPDVQRRAKEVRQNLEKERKLLKILRENSDYGYIRYLLEVENLFQYASTSPYLQKFGISFDRLCKTKPKTRNRY